MTNNEFENNEFESEGEEVILPPASSEDEPISEDTANADSKEKEPKKERSRQKKAGNPDSVKSQVTIVCLWFLALFSTVFFIANIWDNAGPLIYGFCALLYGLFGWGGLLIVPFFILLALEWKNIVLKGDGLYKTLLALSGMLVISSLFHVILIMSGGISEPTFPAVFNSTVFWYHGSPQGGGVLGGFIGGILYILMHGWVSVLTCVLALCAIMMCYLRLTPHALVKAIVRFFRTRSERKKEKLEADARAKELEEKEQAEKKREEEAAQGAVAEGKSVIEGELSQKEKESKPEKEKEERNRASWFANNTFNDEEYEDEEEEEAPHIPTVTVYSTEGDSNEASAKESEPVLTDVGEVESNEEEDTDEPEELDAFDETDFGDGIDCDNFDLSALLSKKEDAPVVADEEDEEESDEYEEDEPTVNEATAKPEAPAYVYPPTSLLLTNRNPKAEDNREELEKNAKKLVEVLRSFKVETEVTNISCGPTITRYELAPKVGVRVRAIANLVDDIALNLETSGVRIEAPIPGKAAVGVEVPKKVPETVYLREIIESPTFQNAKSKLTACVGMDVSGAPVVMDISKLPHMLIAGATGMGKSVAVNCIIMSLLFRTTPDELKLILIDPKKVEFKPYDKLPHLLIPVVSNPKKAAAALTTAVLEMERRFELIEYAGVRDVKGYNKLAENDPTKEKLPSIVIIIDELADLMMTAKDEVEDSICRIAQKARAAGIHLIICTQRPSVDVITGLIKANVPSRIALTVASNVDSRTIIDVAGAEKLIGRGDMLFAPVGAMKPMRVQGAFVDDSEVEAVTTFIREHCKDVTYDDTFIDTLEREAERSGQQKKKVTVDEIDGEDDMDPKFYEAVEIAVDMGKISTSLLQRKLSLGYGRAAKIIDKMEQMGIVGAQEGQKPRTVLFSRQQYQELMLHKDD